MLPEAPVSANVYVEIGGRKVQVTIRGVDEAEVLARVATVIARYPDAPAPSASPPTDGSWCAVHQLTMGLNQKNGQSWYSHRLSDGTFCKGKLKGA